jgi:hypothetical protein
MATSKCHECLRYPCCIPKVLRARSFHHKSEDSIEWRARGLLKRVQLSISGCLGPCDVPNVVTTSNETGTPWLGEISEFQQYQALVDWASRCKDAGELVPLPFLKPFHGNRRAAIFGVATAAALADGEMADDNALGRE